MNPTMSGEEIILALTDENPGALEVLLKLLENNGLEALAMYAMLDDYGLYGADIWNFYKRIHHQDLEAMTDAIRQGEITKWDAPDIEHMAYGEDVGLDAGVNIDEEFFKRNPYELYYFRGAVPGELASVGYPDYDGMIVVIAVKEGVRVRRPCLDEDHGTKEALKFLDILGD